VTDDSDREGAGGERSARRAYGDGDATFQACGGEAGLRRLVESFYAQMAERPEAREILALHPKDLTTSIDKLARFLCGWTGGPKRYAEKYGSIKIPKAHRHLPIHEGERDAWLVCMQHALAEQPYPEDLKRYLLEQLFVPAERIRRVVAERELSHEERATP
jgi:hemoglobin